MDKNKLNNSAKPNTKGSSFIRALLRRMEEGGLTKKEQCLILELEKFHTQEKKRKRKKLSRRELNRAVRRNRQAIRQKRIGSETHRKNETHRKKPIHIQVITTVAAVALLLILAYPFYKRLQLSPGFFEQEVAGTYNRDYQFTTEENIKKITLADGSVIYLNRESSLSLKKGKINSHNREVWLDEGEAFFDIVSDPSRPFIVHSKNGISTRVLGTSFNIKSYGSLSNQVISVNTGRVQVLSEKQEPIIVDPNYKVSVSDEDGSFTAGKTDARSVSEWRSGKIIFDQASLEEIAFRMKQYYNMELVYDVAQFESDHIYSSFTVGTPFEEVITVISKLMNASFTVAQERVYLVKK